MSGAIVAAVIGAAATVYSSDKNAKAQDKAQKQAQAAQQAQMSQAQQQAKAAEEANNRANRNPANANAALSASQSGGSSTMLTGPQGVDQNLLSLGKNTLLGS
ncbi:MAG: hypothetical protein LBJ59_12260 [Zoogloeaceae bacterium]|jgi:type II secretory pathway pseudopilin PulG|nr:hypothetical protein [Zoogloeaceae bacterium]